ncbi:bifunctional adenosylcobinamide kinase/adenosylcobinamide-phosphate guanylyltransferase [Salipiger sp. IMCC34102]|nr:bifunctional adenosylcobinamide kinase/adenosylcobinamide-phosphate guanylyltransferase [Salipiger sp. IMCC34102]
MQGLTFVLGGAASGKSLYAESLVMGMDRPRSYIATAQAFDDEMRAKIARHRDQRGPDWTTMEAPLDLAAALDAVPAGRIVLVDCVTLWLSNLLLRDETLDEGGAAGFLAALDRRREPTVVVSNEVGQGIVPDNALARRFRTLQGGLNRQIADRADRVVAVMAGLPLALKGDLP